MYAAWLHNTSLGRLMHDLNDSDMDGFYRGLKVKQEFTRGLKAMEELAKLEAQRGNPAYLVEGRSVKGGRQTDSILQDGGGISDAAAFEQKERGKKGYGKTERESGGDYRVDDRGDVYQYGGGVL